MLGRIQYKGPPPISDSTPVYDGRDDHGQQHKEPIESEPEDSTNDSNDPNDPGSSLGKTFSGDEDGSKALDKFQIQILIII